MVVCSLLASATFVVGRLVPVVTERGASAGPCAGGRSARATRDDTDPDVTVGSVVISYGLARPVDSSGVASPGWREILAIG